MAEANLQLCIQSYIIRKNELNNELNDLADQKMLISYRQMSNTTEANAKKSAIRREWQKEWQYMFDSAADQDRFLEKYGDYTALDEYRVAMESLNAELAKLQEELTAKENFIDSTITTDSTELSEVNAYIDSFKSMLQNNISADFDYGLK